MNANRIMIIDDDITLLKSVEQILIDQGYIVSLVKSGQQAIDALHKGNTPDLVLLDIAMPDMDGYTTFKKIKEILDVPIIFLTSMEDIKAELTGLELGAIDYITKPFVKDILLARIKNHLLSINGRKEEKKKELPAVRFDETKLKSMEALLTESEYKVGKKIALGYTNQEIAEEYNYSYGYVKKIAYRIFDKLDINKRNEIRSFFLE